MPFDLVIRGGTVVDGSGLARYRADVGIAGDRIVSVGRIDGRGHREIDADGLVVSPGFVDGHTHMDAQIFWDPLGSSSCWHGVTSVVTGNCGFTLAPSRPGEHGLVVDNLERAEDIPAETMAAGIDWTWESFPEYLDAVEQAPKAINYAAQIGHSALRTAAMGERAFTDEANDADFEAMERDLRAALRAGAFGFSTSVSDHHSTPQGRPVASRIGGWEEVCRLVEIVGQEGEGIFQLAVETELTESDDVETARSFYDRLLELAVTSRVPVTYGLRKEHLPTQLGTFDRTAELGGRMFGQCQSTVTSSVYSFETRTPWDTFPTWEEFRAAPHGAQLAQLADPTVRRALAVAVDTTTPGRRRPPGFDRITVVRAGETTETVASVAARLGKAPIEVVLDLALESQFKQVFGRVPSAQDDADLLTAMRHPRTIMTFSDAGAHVSHHSGAEMQTTLLADWVRAREAFTLEEGVRMLTLAPALAWRLPERGLLREGYIADLNIFDPATIAPGVPEIVHDLPAGAPRVLQRAVGIASTIVGGEEVFSHGEHTGALSGRLLRAVSAHG